MHTISFNKNWNGKLMVAFFGTIRLHNPEKYVVGYDHKVLLNKMDLGIATIKTVRTFELKDISNALAFLDAGMDAQKTIGMLMKMYKYKMSGGVNIHTKIDHIIYCWKERNIVNHGILFADYWNDISIYANEFLNA